MPIWPRKGTLPWRPSKNMNQDEYLTSKGAEIMHYLSASLRRIELEYLVPGLCENRGIGVVNRHLLAISLFCVALLQISTALAHAQVFDEVETGNTCSYFGESVPPRVTTFSSDREAEDVINRIVEASGLVQNFEVHAAGVPNAAAIIRGDTRYVLYNQYFVQNTKQSTGSSWAPISIMAHEVGHHLNGHTLDNRGSRPKTELEADYYSGFILQRMGSTLESARVAMNKLGSSQGSASHPPKHDRLAAIASGWTKACEADSGCSSRGSTPAPQREERESRTPGPDSCEYARDGECDEPDLCEPGTDTADCERERSRRDRPSRDTEPRQLYCCDNYGRKWCAIRVNPGPPGTPCWCAGVPGSGRMCH